MICFLSCIVNCKCTPPRITVSLNKTLEYATVLYTNERFVVTAEFTNNCSSLRGINLQWEVSKCDEGTRHCNTIIPYGRPGSALRKTIYPRIFGAGYLYVRCAVKQYGHKVLTYDFGYVRIILVPLEVNLIGPHTAIRGNTSLVLLDASKSYDPDYRYKKTEGLIFSWYCKQDVETFDSQEASSHEHGNGTDGCYGDGPGKINNSLTFLVVEVDKMKGNRTYVFEVVVQKEEGRISRLTHRLTVYEPFVLSLRLAGISVDYLMEHLFLNTFLEVNFKLKWYLSLIVIINNNSLNLFRYPYIAFFLHLRSLFKS